MTTRGEHTEEAASIRRLQVKGARPEVAGAGSLANAPEAVRAAAARRLEREADPDPGDCTDYPGAA